MATPYAFVTLISSDSYLPGALALVAALRDVHPNPPAFPEVDFRTVCLVTPETVDVSCIKLLRRAFDVVIGVEIIEDDYKKGLELLGRPDLNTVLTKLHAFRLTQFSKIIFIDADVLPIRPLSHLFTLDHEFSAVPDVGWPDIFNSGMMVFSPGDDKFEQLRDLLKASGTWDGGDQGLLNEWRGGNWNRLSFTYNTTPTAAYTYAPAYERFGSQISAVHFIGPNKPWHSISYRAPGVEHAQPSDSGSQQAYDYTSLVDKWYQVYDNHYRSVTVPSPEFEVQKYESVWNDQNRHVGEEVSLGQTQTANDSNFDLEQLRKMAVEGLSQISSTFVGHVGEGEYRSMPLDGRVDLMRPRKELSQKPPEELEADTKARIPSGSDVLSFLSTPAVSDTAPPMRTLPTPNPEDIPPTPYRTIISLPPTPMHPDKQRETDPTEKGSLPYEQPDRDVHQQLFDKHVQHAEYQGSPGVQVERTESRDRHRVSPPREHVSDAQQPSDQYDQHEVAVSPQPNRPAPPPSPPLFPWNPAVEPPPKIPPGSYAFPSDTYFPNIWDKAPSKLHDATYQLYSHEELDSHSGHMDTDQRASVFFHPPPTSEIPEHLVREGHYRNVTGTLEVSEAPPTPDPSKVIPIFPWEEKPRHMPGRVFPQSDIPPPGTFLEPQKKPSIEVSATQEMTQRRVPPPLIGLPFSLNYANAWDTIPSIQSYASKLARPHLGLHHRPISPSHSGEWKKQEKDKVSPWLAPEEENSMDGDDEDEESDNMNLGKSSKPRSRSASGSSTPQGSVYGHRGKKYRGRGIQTIQKETRSQGVQVNTGVVPGQLDAAPYSRFPTFAHGSSPPDSEQWSTSMPAHHRASLGHSSLLHSPSGYASPRTLVSPRNYSPPKSLSPLAMRSPKSSPPRAATPNKTPSPKGPVVITTVSSVGVHLLPTTPSTQSVPVLARSISNDTAISSAGPSSPVDGSPIVTHRKTGRVWDPARGVDIFKRDSEEVLSRFLKMGSFEDNGFQQA